jgi:hypothetical protein
VSEIILGGWGWHGGGSAGWHVVWGYGGRFAPPGLCLTHIENPSPGRLCVFFSAVVKPDAPCRDPRNYVITPLPGYEDHPITITGVDVGTDRVCLDFIGGYSITVHDVRRNDNDVLIDEACNKLFFRIDKPGVAPRPRIRVFDTVLGPIGLRQVNVGIQTVEDLLQQRSISQGVTAQLSNIISELGPAGAVRDDSRIPFLRIR